MQGVDGWMADRMAEGWSLSHNEVQTGFAWDRVILKFPNPKISNNKIELKGEYLSVSQYFIDPGHLKVVLNGRNLLTIGDKSWVVSASPLRVDLIFSRTSEHMKSLHATATDVHVGTGDTPALTAQALGLAVVSTNSAPDHNMASAQFVGTAAGLVLDAAAPGPSHPVTVAEVSGKLMGAFLAAAPLQSLTQWSADGGTVEVERFMVEWPPIKIEGSGTVALDHQLQPVAAFAAQVQGGSHLADTLRQNFGLSGENAENLQSQLRGQPGAPLPITIQDGKIWLGSIAVADQPPLRWPE